MFKTKIKTIVLAASAIIMAIGLITFPEESFEASIRGLNMWWEIVFPSLLPFFIISELLIGFGVVKFIGVILEPIMRPLFKVPGVGGFVWAMGMASGFPSGAKYTARMRQEKLLTKIEAERLVSFTNYSSPLFMFGAVSVGFFHNSSLGIMLASSHYLGNICVGLLMRFHGKDDDKTSSYYKKAPSIKTALQQMHRTRLNEKRPLGKLLGDAVLSSIHTLLMIGGFIILFSVINKLLFHMNVTSILAQGVIAGLHMIHFPEELSMAFISGLSEITIGSQMTSGVEQATLMQKAIITSFILGFSGFSIQAQVASILAETDIRFSPFFFARIVHGILAATFTFILWKPIYEKMGLNGQPSNSNPVFMMNDNGIGFHFYEKIMDYGPLITIAFLTLYFIIGIKRNFIHH
ncbi:MULTISPECIES: sporulation integral membrane protein YlbJ [Bacillaceae]|uniref:Sporulation integral membrane protein YlbJ n=1 Tax=Peribacillus huizhouensis TaxID=1501239 RepID=A0ABR6CIU8_9BACI|nr:MULTISPECIES: sporulation integral membrane protein YlbJ [Bacillaceae]MBA9024983.1 sporulation integral membrane protein YlbJ [Peribacillus huizhouensis]